MAKNGAQWQQMTAPQRELHGRQAQAQIERLFGDKASERIALARQMIHELEAKKPGLIRYLEETGAGNSVALIANLALHGERLKARHGK